MFRWADVQVSLSEQTNKNLLTLSVDISKLMAKFRDDPAILIKIEETAKQGFSFNCSFGLLREILILSFANFAD